MVDRRSTVDADAPPAEQDRRTHGERRTYTRRTPQVTPPYFEVFERIAVALESIATAVGQRQVVLPSDPPRPRPSRNG
jgi:hypothetical protein